MHGVDVLQDMALAGRGIGAVPTGEVLDLVVDVEQMLPQRLSCVGLVIAVGTRGCTGHLGL